MGDEAKTHLLCGVIRFQIRFVANFVRSMQGLC